ncbi:MAG TPA: hypothetical protein VHA37_07525 [Candidatus Saccharimonadales bacterium]|nr:hypothetical protein [Candidatus Saccharimonadales bacterium]
MAHGHPVTLQPAKLMLGSTGTRLGIGGLFVGVVALAAAAILGMQNPQARLHFFHSYLFAYCFFFALTMGGLGYTMIHHLTRAGWSVAIRRLCEGLAMNIFLLAILMIPLIAMVPDLYPWFNHAHRVADEELMEKVGYLNPTFFFIRLAAYFVLWGFLAFFFWSRSIKQDKTGDPKITVAMERVAAPFIYLYGFSLTGFVFDWVMSLNPYWFSTIFGVYFFAGCMLSMWSTVVLMALYFKKRGLVGDAINHEHFHDLGKWMFAFTFFWGYVAFAQYMLTWYSNLPEETQFFIPRQIGVWASLSLVLLLVHLLIPFPGLLSRHVKRRNGVIAFWAMWSVCACIFDVWWLIIPNEWINKVPHEINNDRMPITQALTHLSQGTTDMYTLSSQHAAFAAQINYPLQPLSVLVTALCLVGIGGLYVFSTVLTLRKHSLIPMRDPRLPEALAFENM